jgi:hypothetical protein
LHLEIFIIIIGKTAVFEPWPSLQYSVKFQLDFTSSDLATIFFSYTEQGSQPCAQTPNRTIRLYPEPPDSLFVTFYDSRGYRGGILTCLHMENLKILAEDKLVETTYDMVTMSI